MSEREERSDLAEVEERSKLSLRAMVESQSP